VLKKLQVFGAFWILEFQIRDAQPVLLSPLSDAVTEDQMGLAPH
jgi:hypothetical protein